MSNGVDRVLKHIRAFIHHRYDANDASDDDSGDALPPTYTLTRTREISSAIGKSMTWFPSI